MIFILGIIVGILLVFLIFLIEINFKFNLSKKLETKLYPLISKKGSILEVDSVVSKLEETFKPK
jgi:hypothetical protein